MFETILVATDGSDHAQKAVQTAVDLASRYGSKLVVAHVLSEQSEVPDGLMRMAEVEHLVESLPDTRGRTPNAMAPMVRITDSESRVRKVLEAVGERLTSEARNTAKAAGVRDIQSVVDEGDPPTQILKRANAVDADLIVIGSRGLGTLTSLLMGSVSSKVCHLAHCPVLTVK